MTKRTLRYTVIAMMVTLMAVPCALAAWSLAWSLGAAAEHSVWPLTVDGIEAFMRQWGALSAVASIALMVLHSFVPLPAEAIAIANGMLFGAAWGVAVTWIGAMMGASCAFATARYLGRPLGNRLVSKRYWQEIANWRGDPSTLLLVRLIPIISFNLVNFAAGLTGIGWPTFLWTTGLGILPITVASVVMGNLLLLVPWPFWVAGALGLIVIWYTIHAIARRRCPAHSLSHCGAAVLLRSRRRAGE